ncbi:MAG: tetratricopeptide repeat protein [Xanthobacteraceae bacterium]
MARHATARPPRSIEQAFALHQQGRLDEAGRIYGAILAADPDHFNALHLSGLIEHQQGRSVEALRLVAAALKAQPKAIDALTNYAAILDALDRHQEALASYDAALAVAPDRADIQFNRGRALLELERFDDAVASFDRILVGDPGNIGALIHRGNALIRSKRPSEALANYDRALALNPDQAGGLTSRGLALADLGRFSEALACHEHALRLEPKFVDAHINRGYALVGLRRMEEALASFAEATALSPHHAEAHFNMALARLRLGDFSGGWKEYEYRWDRKHSRLERRNFPQPMWRGEKDLHGKTVLLHHEQGFGDTIQFMRYAPLVAALGAKVLLGVQRPLAALALGVPGVAGVLSDGDTMPDFDLHCPLANLPPAFATELATIPANIPYLRPYAERVAKWQDRLPASGRLRVGISWAGNSSHVKDHHRSIPLERFAAVLSVPGLDFVSLQKDVDEPQAAVLRAHGVVQLGDEFEDFADTAAVVAMLDLVVAVDTAVAHLAGAMGKPVALLLAFVPDWRWLLDRTDSPWYPTMRLFRQSSFGDWDAPLAQLRQELADVARRPVGPR